MKYEKYYKGRNDLFSGIVLSAFSIAYLIGATRIKIPKMLSSSFLNASSVPKLWGTLLLILGIILVIRGVRVMKAEKAAGNAPEKKTAAQMVKDFWSANRAVQRFSGCDRDVCGTADLHCSDPAGGLPDLHVPVPVCRVQHPLLQRGSQDRLYTDLCSDLCSCHLCAVQIRFLDAAPAGYPEGNLLRKEGTDHVNGRLLHGVR